MHKTIVGVAALSLLVGVGAGWVFSPTKTVVRTESAKATSTDVVALPVECRSALELAGTGLGAALAGLGQAQSAISVSLSSDAPTPVLGVLGQSNARVQNVLAQYNQDRAACTAAAGVAAAGVASPNRNAQ